MRILLPRRARQVSPAANLIILSSFKLDEIIEKKDRNKLGDVKAGKTIKNGQLAIRAVSSETEKKDRQDCLS
jgi:hypothetical protein